MKKVLLIILGIFILGILGRNIIAEKAVEIGTQAVTGAKLDIGKLKIGLLSGVIDIKNIRLYNPKGFKDPLMVEIPEVYVSYKTTSLLTGKIYIKD
ncbi:MAG: hypothetical protein KC684_09575, partial [Candidatus Omnitrophica bacterium]|nr:hypothetical protein [Candidatus Omnitrophota bacterium]